MKGVVFVVIFALSATPAVVPASIFSDFFRSFIKDAECVPNEYAPYPGDCSKFKQCDDGVWVVRQCSGGTVWNQGIEDCDNPANVDCSDTSSSSSTSTTTSTASTTSSTETTPSIPTPAPPPGPCDDGQYAPYYGNCAKFYQCEQDKWTAKDCPDFTIWDQNSTNCVYQEDGVCDNTTTLAPTTTTTPTPTTSPAPIPCTRNGELLPNPNNCSKFYECANHILVEFECEPGLWFNNATKHCDFPDNVECGGHTTTSPRTTSTGTTTTSATTTTSPTTVTTTSPTSTATTGSTASRTTTTPYPGSCSDGEYAPDPTDCGKYLQCEEDKWTVKDCPDNTVWDATLEECLFPGETVCQTSTTSTPTPSTSTTGSTSTASTSTSSTTVSSTVTTGSTTVTTQSSTATSGSTANTTGTTTATPPSSRFLSLLQKMLRRV